MELLNFKHFLETYEEAPNFLGAVQDILGVKPELFGKDPSWVSNISLGQVSFNGIFYQITKIIRDPDGKIKGALIKPMNVSGNETQRKYFDKNKMQSPDSSVSSSGFFVPIDKLSQMLNQDFAPSRGGMGF